MLTFFDESRIERSSAIVVEFPYCGEEIVESTMCCTGASPFSGNHRKH